MRLSPNDEMVDIMMDNILEHSKSMAPGHDPDYLDYLFSGLKKGDVLRPYVQAMADACLKLDHMLLQLIGERAFSGLDKALVKGVDEAIKGAPGEWRTFPMTTFRIGSQATSKMQSSSTLNFSTPNPR